MSKIKFSAEESNVKHFSEDLKISEYMSGTDLPMDCAIANFKNGASYPIKKNVDFFEMFYVLKGKLTIDFNVDQNVGDIVVLDVGDVAVIPPNIAHKVCTDDFADVLIVCNPPFDIKNIEFL
jgi:quercetin dioxygenase-like cupin family protein